MKRKILVLLVCVTSSLSLFSQKIVEDRTDSFTGDIIVRTSSITLSRDIYYPVFSIEFRSINNEVFIKAYLNKQGYKAFFVEKGYRFLLKFDNDNIIEVNSLGYALADNNDYSENSTEYRRWYISPIYGGNMTSIGLDNLITSIRVYMSNGYQDYDISEKRAKQIQKAYRLLMERVDVDEVESAIEETKNNNLNSQNPIENFWSLSFGLNEKEVREVVKDKFLQEIPLDSAGISLDINEHQHSISFKYPKMGIYQFDTCLITFLNDKLQSIAFEQDFEDYEEALKFFLDLKQILDNKYGSSTETESKGINIFWNDDKNRAVALMRHTESNIEKIVLYYKDYGLKPYTENKMDISDF